MTLAIEPMAFAVVLMISCAIVAVVAISICFVKLRHGEQPMAKKTGAGWVLLRQRGSEHFCRPPDTDGASNLSFDDESEPQLVYTNYQTPTDKWTTGDIWLCDCGKAWRIQQGGSALEGWHRYPKEDMA